MFNFAPFQVNKYKAFQNAMVKNQVNKKMTIGDGDFILPSDKSKTFSQFQEKMFQVLNKLFFQFTFQILILLWNTQKLKNIRIF